MTRIFSHVSLDCGEGGLQSLIKQGTEEVSKRLSNTPSMPEERPHHCNFTSCRIALSIGKLGNDKTRQ